MASTLSNIAARLGLTRSGGIVESLGEITARRDGTAADPLSLDAVYRCIGFHQTAFSQLSFDVQRPDGPVERTVADRPNVWQSLPAFLAITVASLDLRGNAYWRVTRNPTNQPIQLSVLDPASVIIDTAKTGAPIYRVGSERLTHLDVAHMAIMRRPGTPYGLSPIDACRETVDGALKLRSWADNWLSQGHVPNGTLMTDATLSSAQAQEYKEAWRKSVTYENGPAVLGSGLKYQPLFLTPEQMQFLASQRANVLSVARMFGVPSRVVLATPDGGSDSYANLDADLAFWLRFSGMGYVREIEEAMTSVLPNGQTARLNLDALARADLKTRYEAHKLGLDAGFITVDEVRAIEHLPALEAINV